MKYEAAQGPFEGLEKGDVSLVLVSPTVQRIKSTLTKRRDALIRDLGSSARMAAVDMIHDDGFIGRQFRATGAALAEVERALDIFEKGESYARA